MTRISLNVHPSTLNEDSSQDSLHSSLVRYLIMMIPTMELDMLIHLVPGDILKLLRDSQTSSLSGLVGVRQDG